MTSSKAGIRALALLTLAVLAGPQAVAEPSGARVGEVRVLLFDRAIREFKKVDAKTLAFGALTVIVQAVGADYDESSSSPSLLITVTVTSKGREVESQTSAVWPDPTGEATDIFVLKKVVPMYMCDGSLTIIVGKGGRAKKTIPLHLRCDPGPGEGD